MFIRPVAGGIISQRYGNKHPRYGAKGHEGTDVAVPVGTAVVAAADGWVHEVHLKDDGPYGIHLRTLHIIDGECYMIVYAHLSEISPALYKGKTVQRGEYVAKTGNTGTSTGPHLHVTVKMFDAARRGLADQPYDVINSDKYFNW